MTTTGARSCPTWCVVHETLEDGMNVHLGKPSKRAANLRVQPTLRFDCDSASVCVLNPLQTEPIECLSTQQAHKLARALSAAASLADAPTPHFLARGGEPMSRREDTQP